MHSIEQNNTDKTIPRRKLNEDDLITIRLLKRSELKITYSDMNSMGDITYIDINISGLSGNVTIAYDYTPFINFFDPSEAWYVPADTDLTVAWTLFSGAYLNGQSEKTGTATINIAEGQVGEVIIER